MKSIRAAVQSVKEIHKAADKIDRSEKAKSWKPGRALKAVSERHRDMVFPIRSSYSYIGYSSLHGRDLRQQNPHRKWHRKLQKICLSTVATKGVTFMPRVSKERKLVWQFFFNCRNCMTNNPLCRKCAHGCKQSSELS